MPFKTVKWRVRHHRIARRNPHRQNFGLVLRAYVQEQGVTWKDAGPFFRRHYVDIANTSHRANWPLRPDNDPALIHQRLIEPAAQHLHRQQTLRRDAADHPAQLVHVRIHHDAWPLGALFGDD